MQVSKWRDYRVALNWVIVILLSSVITVIAHSDEEPTSQFTFGVYLIIMAVISIIVATGIVLIKRFETVPGSLPIRKLGIAGVITIVINGIIIAYLYREVLF